MNNKDIVITSLLNLTTEPMKELLHKYVVKPFMRWYYGKRSEWAMMSADVEKMKTNEARLNERHYHNLSKDFIIKQTKYK